MPDLSGRELLSEWRQVMDTVISSAASAAGRAELPGDLLRASQRQLELMQEIVDGELRRQGNLIGALLAPIEAVFDLLEETGSTLRRQAEALEAAGVALQETAALMKVQAELFERVIGVMRQPTGFARVATGRSKRTRATSRTPAKSSSGRAAATAERPRKTASRASADGRARSKRS
jgi:hypothetical protein